MNCTVTLPRLAWLVIARRGAVVGRFARGQRGGRGGLRQWTPLRPLWVET
jgi:hypothetical protein